MDTLLLSPSVPKRPCFVHPPPPPPPPPPVEYSHLTKSNNMVHLLQTFLTLSDSSPISLDLSLERIVESRASDSDQNDLIESALRLGSLLLESGKKLQRKKFTKHNSLSWLLPPDLTIKVFSMLDTQSLCYAATTCSMFHKYALDPLCYGNIDLTSVVPKINNVVVCTMIQRAGKNLQSLKLGILPAPITSSTPSCPMVYTIRHSTDAGFSWNERRSRQGKESYVLTRSCLMSLSADGGAAGALLRRLHLYNIDRMDNAGLCGALSSCPSLLDLKVVGLHVELRQILECLSTNCHMLERLFFESSKTGRDDSLKKPTCAELVNGCPHITTLSLRGFQLQDYKIRVLLKGFRKLMIVDLSSSYSITGGFLRYLGANELLEVLILRDCMHLKETEVALFLEAVIAGDFKFLRYLDISNKEGLASDADWYDRCYSPRNLPLRQVSEGRPEICLVAEFPPEGSYIDMEQIINSDNSEVSLDSKMSSHQSDASLFMSSSESCYNSDQGSGNEDGIMYDGSSDEVNFLPG